MKRLDDRYTFSYAVPDSTDIILISILNAKGEVFDNNAGTGFTVYPLKNGKQFPTAGITKANLLSGFADYYLKERKCPDILLVRHGFSRPPLFIR